MESDSLYVIRITVVKLVVLLLNGSFIHLPVNKKHLSNMTSKMLGRRCTNVIQMFCVCWALSAFLKCLLLQQLIINAYPILNYRLEFLN